MLQSYYSTVTPMSDVKNVASTNNKSLLSKTIDELILDVHSFVDVIAHKTNDMWSNIGDNNNHLYP